MDFTNEEQFKIWVTRFKKIFEQVHFLESCTNLPSQLTGVNNKDDLMTRFKIGGIIPIKKTYKESEAFLNELNKLEKKYPNIVRENEIAFNTIRIKTADIYSHLNEISDGGKLFNSRRKSLAGWIKKEMENILAWVKNNPERKELLYQFLVNDKEFQDLKKSCHDSGTINFPNFPPNKESYNDCIKKYKSKNSKELDELIACQSPNFGHFPSLGREAEFT